MRSHLLLLTLAGVAAHVPSGPVLPSRLLEDEEDSTDAGAPVISEYDALLTDAFRQIGERVLATHYPSLKTDADRRAIAAAEEKRARRRARNLALRGRQAASR